MTKDEALKLALEALEHACGDRCNAEYNPCFQREAITAIKEALAQPEPNYKKALEVWLDKTEWVQQTVKPHELGMHRADVLKQRIQEALAQPEQEPIGYASEGVAERLTTVKQAHEQIRSFRLFTHDVPLYTTPPQRTWVGLTDKDWNRSKHNYDFQKGVDWAESILKEKNT